MRRVIALLPLLLVAFVAPAGAAVAPGRVEFAVGQPEPQNNVDAGGASAAVALPDGGAVLLAPEFGRGIVAAGVRADRSLESGFGRGGVAHVRVPSPTANPVALPGGPFFPLQLLRQSDGRLIVVGFGPARTPLELPQIVLLRLTANGALDATFGQGGVARPGFQASCGGLCHPASLQADGAIVVTGNTGGLLAPPTGPDAPANFQWIVARLTPTGALDPSFGQGGTVQLSSPGRNSGGFGTALLGDGRIVALGRDTSSPLLMRLLPSGASDPSFHGGAPAPLAIPFTLRMLLHPDGFVDVLGDQRLVRYGADGEPDLGFGAAGAVDLPRSGDMPALLPLGGRSVLVYVGAGIDPRPAALGDLRLWRITADGRFGPGAGGAVGLSVQFGFGGGFANSLASGQPSQLPDLRQTSFRTAEAVQRPDGSLLVTGGVHVVRYTGEGAGRSTGRFAVGALTPGLAVDRRFGGTATQPRLRVRVARQRTRTSARLKRVVLRVTCSGPGLVLIRARARGRVIAQGLEPLFASGTSTIRLPTVGAGERLLRHRRRVTITVTARARDLVAQRALARAQATLRR